MDQWIRDAMDKLNSNLECQGETTEKYFGKERTDVETSQQYLSEYQA